MGTGMMSGSGSYDVATNILSEEGTFSCPSREGETKFRMITTLVDQNSYQMDMYGPDLKTGKEFLSMEITYSRK